MSPFSKKIKFPFLFTLLSSLFGDFSPLVVTQYLSASQQNMDSLFPNIRQVNQPAFSPLSKLARAVLKFLGDFQYFIRPHTFSGGSKHLFPKSFNKRLIEYRGFMLIPEPKVVARRNVMYFLALILGMILGSIQLYRFIVGEGRKDQKYCRQKYSQQMLSYPKTTTISI